MSRPRLACALLALSLGGCFEDEPGTCDISQPAAPWEDSDGDGYVGTDDCDDTSFATNPSATERCDGLDNNCDGSTDGPESVDATTWYLDADGDGFGDDTNAETSCEELASHAPRGGDCDDSDAAFYPGAPEDDCTDPNDYNCDGSAGGEDADEDGYFACNDCDDADPLINPGAVEIWYDGVDGNCDLLDDYDADQDGHDIDAYGGDDCDDTDPAVNPEAEDVPDDGEDQNCDGGDASACDLDEDGYDADSATCGGSDCDDLDGAVHPGADETCDGADDDCDGLIDDADPDLTGASAWYADADADGYGDPGESALSCIAPSGYGTDSSDCDDLDLAIHPGAGEVCDGVVDEDCDGLVDDADSAVYGTSTWYADADADGYGDASTTVDACEVPAGFTDDTSDCDDTDASVNPAASETVGDEVDVNCDAQETCYTDADLDGYGDESGVTLASADTDCADSGEASAADPLTDCDDSDAGINPSATEICDGVDDDCDGTIDEDDSSLSDASAWYADDDGDGYGDPGRSTLACSAPSGTVSNGDDCDDTDAAVNPGADEICDAADVDEDCDGLADDADASTVDRSTWYRDADDDGYGDASTTVDACALPSGYTTDASDCDDADASVNPGASEATGDEVDSNCDGRETCYTDADLDGYADDSGATRTSTDADCADNGEASRSDPLTDCDDTDATINPGASEICDSMDTDEDCDGVADDDDASATGQTVWYADADDDTYGILAVRFSACNAPAGYADDATDCDDADANINPSEAEICDSVDDDCDGLVDEDDLDLTGADTYYRDSDGDAYGDPLNAGVFCSRPPFYTTDDTDCDDTDSSINPGGTEVANDGVDSDCDGYDPATDSIWTLDDCSADGGISLVVQANGAFGACVVSGTDFYGDDPSCSWRPPLLVASDGTQYEIRTASTTNDVQLSDTEATSKIVLSALPDLDIQIDQVLTGTTLTQTYTFTNNGATDLDYDVYRTSDPDLDFGFQAAHPYTSSSPEPQPAVGSCPSGDVEYGGRCCPDFNPTCTSSLYNTRKGYAGFNVPWEIDGDPAACSYDRVSDATAGYCVAEGDGGGDATYDGYRMVMGQSNGSAIHAHLGYALGFYVQERQETTTVRYVLKDDGSDETLADLPQDVPSGDPLPGIDWDYAFGVGGAGDLGILLSWQLHIPAGGSATLVTTTIWTPAVECP